MKNEDITTFAPVCIPTLCRYEHFKRCIESLAKCTWVEYTDLFVAIDYPTKETHWEGYNKIKAYIETVKPLTFKSINVIYRDHNYGTDFGGNLDALLDEVKQKYDRFIITEDDNEFSPNFIIYMNKMLERFKEDERIYCVCGYNHKVQLPDYYRNNYYIARSFCAWGGGYWSYKKLPERYYSWDFLKSIIINNDTYQLLKDRGPNFTEGLMSMLKAGHFWGDMQIALYETLEYKYNICPTLSKVRNHGNDGTGVHCQGITEMNNHFVLQSIDENTDFVIGDDYFVMMPDGIKKQKPPKLNVIKKLCIDLIKQFDIFMLRHFNIIFHTKYI